MRILIAEDTAFWRRQIEDILSGRGDQLIWARDGAHAWEILAADEDVDLLITDWEMPRMNGLDLCRNVRDHARAAYLPIIMLTSREGKRDLTAGLDAGADAFVTKPINEPELLAQIGVCARILKLEADLDARMQEVTRAKARLDRDLEAAAAVQRSLLPERPPEIPGLDFGWVYESCERVGGDMFNVFQLSENRVGMYILDVSGHGTPAALLSVGLGHVLTPFPEQGGILKRRSAASGEVEITPPSEVACELNRRYPLMEKSRQYLTFLYGILDLQTLVFQYVCAGHPGPVQLTSSGARSHDSGGGIPIGINETVRYRDERIALSPGESVVFYTDGVSEALDEREEQFGVDRMLKVLSDARESGIAARVKFLLERIEEFAKGGRLRDDVTVVGLELL